MLSGGFAMNAYEKAIDAYRFQVGRYHTWMNFYSLFNGALLIAVYSLQCKTCKESNVLLLFLGVVGLIAGLCWLGSIIGNRYWMNSWLQIVKELEKNEPEKKEVEKKEGRKEETVPQIYNTVLFNDGQERNFLSTPVLTQLFITIVVLAWSAYIVYIAGLLDYGSYAFIGLIVFLIYCITLYWKSNSWINSEISSMNRLILIIFISTIGLSSCTNKSSTVEQSEEQIEEQTNYIEQEKQAEIISNESSSMIYQDNYKSISYFNKLFMPAEALISVINEPGQYKKDKAYVASSIGYPFAGFEEVKISSMDYAEKGYEVKMGKLVGDQYGYLVFYVPEVFGDELTAGKKYCVWGIMGNLDLTWNRVYLESVLIGETKREIAEYLADIKDGIETKNAEKLKHYFDVEIGYCDGISDMTWQSSVEKYAVFFQNAYSTFPYDEQTK